MAAPRCGRHLPNRNLTASDGESGHRMNERGGRDDARGDQSQSYPSCAASLGLRFEKIAPEAGPQARETKCQGRSCNSTELTLPLSERSFVAGSNAAG